jgi:hypothetical protein
LDADLTAIAGLTGTSGLLKKTAANTWSLDTTTYQTQLAKKGSTNKPIYVSAAGTISECTTYAGGTAVTFNGASKAGSTASFYAPTVAGTSGQILKSSGGEPTWVNQSTLSVGSATKATQDGSGNIIVDTYVPQVASDYYIRNKTTGITLYGPNNNGITIDSTTVEIW